MGDLIRAAFRCQTGGQQGEVTCEYSVTAVAGTGISTQDAADQLTILSDAQWPAILTPQSHTLGVRVELVNRANAQVLQSAYGVDSRDPGVVSGPMAPGGAAAIVRKRTGLAGPGFRGRMFVPFIPASFLSDSGELTAASRVTYLTFANALISVMTLTVGANSVTLTPSIEHRVSDRFPLPVTDQYITTVDVPGLVGYQRRRGDYGKPNIDI